MPHTIQTVAAKPRRLDVRKHRIICYVFLGILAFIVIAFLAFFIGQLTIITMNSKSMQSDVAKARGGTVPYGAVALVSRLKGLSVRRGGLVLVELSNEGQRIKTIRRVVAIP